METGELVRSTTGTAVTVWSEGVLNDVKVDGSPDVAIGDVDDRWSHNRKRLAYG